MNTNPESKLSQELETPLQAIVKEVAECPTCISGTAPMDPVIFGPALADSL